MEADEAGTLRALSDLLERTILPLIDANGGRCVKLMGDGVLAEFGSVIDAVNCAMDWQGQLGSGGAIRFRIGNNLGDIIVQGDDIFGDGVNIAARLDGLAEPGGICISEAVHAEIRKKTDLQFQDLGEQRLKNISEPLRAYRIR